MKEAKNRRVTAFFFDVFFIGSIIQIFSAFFISFTSTKIALHVNLSCAILYLGSLILYHSLFAKKIAFCTPGESMAGCMLIEGGKKWFSHFNKSRWFLFITLFLLLINPANAFDSIQKTMQYPLPMILGTSIRVILLLFMIFQISKGNFVWSVGLFIYYFLQLVIALRKIQNDPVTLNLFISFVGAQILALLISVIIYKKIILTKNEQQHLQGPADETSPGL